MKNKILVFFTVLIAGLCSIVYELLISATATYFLGDGVKQFSILIGIYLFSMGIGAFVAKYFSDRPLSFFVVIEYILGLIGGLAVPLLYFLFVTVEPFLFQIYCLLIMFCIGLLTGMEVPLLTFAYKDADFKNNLSNVLSLDYIGGLIATLIFPFILLPFVGLFYSSLITGCLNIFLGLILSFAFLKKKKLVGIIGLTVLVLLMVVVVSTGKLLKIWDQKIYKSPVVTNIQTPYQKIVITKKKDDVRLFLNRVIQFSSADEHRYHEPLIHIPLSCLERPKRILVLGGGENLASRELLKHQGISEVDVVDIDSMMFYLAKNDKFIKKINGGAANSSRVRLVNEDAFSFLYLNKQPYDLIVADLPDPSNEAIARLYSKQFYLLVKKNLKETGLFVTQAGEIYYSNTVFSCIYETMTQVFSSSKIYHSFIPSFGNWGFIMAADHNITPKLSSIPGALKYLSDQQAEACFLFPKDITIAKTKVNTLDNPIILNYYLHDWNKWKSEFATTVN